MSEARNLIKERKMEDATSILGLLKGEVADLMEEARKEAGLGPGVCEALKNIDRYEALLDLLQEKSKTLSKKGVDVSQLLAKIEESRNLIQEVVEKLKEGKVTVIEDLLAQIDEMVEEAISLADQLEEAV